MSSAAHPHTSRDKYLEAVGRRILGEANDLKRTPELLAEEMGLPLGTVQAILQGSASVDAVKNFIHQMADHYPISLSSIWVERDDTDHGVLIMRSDDSRASARTLNRRLPGGQVVPYFEYLDTAMSKTAPFKPELVRELQIVGDADPRSDKIAMNNGHLMHQLTFYVGDVNAYWSVGGKSYCATLGTGDSTYMAPFVPHSFASRDKHNLGYIVAVTYGGPVRFALDEFARLAPDDAAELAGDLRQGNQIMRARLHRQLMSESLSLQQLAERASSSGTPAQRVIEIATGGEPTYSELSTLAACLNIRVQDLLVDPDQSNDVVVVKRVSERISRPFPEGSNSPDYILFELARTKYQPGLKAFDVSVLNQEPATLNGIRHGLHEYIYNYSNAPAALYWHDGREELIAPGDSAYIAPMTPHAFGRAGAEEPRLLVVRVPGTITDVALDEFAGFDPAGRARTAGENVRWY